MFNTRTPQQTLRDVTSDIGPVVDEILALEELAFEHLENQADFVQHADELQLLIMTMQDLTTLHKTIGEHGLNVALLAFINPNNSLHQTIPEIPSLESLTTDLPADACEIVLEGLAGKLKDLAKRIIDKLQLVVKNTITDIKLSHGSTDAIRNRLNNLTEAVKDKYYEAEMAKRRQAPLFKFTMQVECLDFAIGANALALELLALELPTTEEQAYTWHTKFAHVLEKHLSHYSFMSAGRANLPHTTKASFYDLGYDEHAFGIMHDKIEAYLRDRLSTGGNVEHAIQTLSNKVDDMLDHLSVTYEKDSDLVTEYSAAGYILYNAMTRTLRYIRSVTTLGYNDGVLRALRTMSGLTRIYTADA